MSEGISLAELSAGAAAFFVWLMFCREFYSMEASDDRESFILFCLLAGLLASVYTLWYLGHQGLMAVVPWIWCCFALVVFSNARKRKRGVH